MSPVNHKCPDKKKLTWNVQMLFFCSHLLWICKCQKYKDDTLIWCIWLFILQYREKFKALFFWRLYELNVRKSVLTGTHPPPSPISLQKVEKIR